MSFENLLEASKKYYPNIQIKFKNESKLMKLIGKILFFNKNFMSTYTTTIDSTIYFINKEELIEKPIPSMIVFLHELTHIYDSKKDGKLLFKFLYLFPQILILLFFPLLLISWKLSLLALIFALPFPAIFRKKYELKAYKVSLYCSKYICDKYNFDSDTYLINLKKDYIEKFTGSYYYFMWNFKNNIEMELTDAIDKINNNQKPFEDPIFNIIDDLLINC